VLVLVLDYFWRSREVLVATHENCVCVCAWLQSAEASLVLEKAIAEEMKQKAAQLEKELASRMISLDKAEAAAEISATRR
jgi:hypothetical protein